MIVGITEGNHCIDYKESKPNDMGSSVKDNMMKLAAMWHDYSMRLYRLVALYRSHSTYLLRYTCQLPKDGKQENKFESHIKMS
jgi:hypothetical protein